MLSFAIFIEGRGLEHCPESHGINFLDLTFCWAQNFLDPTFLGSGKKFERKKVRSAEKVELFSSRTFVLQFFFVHMEAEVLQQWQTTHFKAWSK